MSSVNNLCKQFEPRSGPTYGRPWSGVNPFDTQMKLMQHTLFTIKLILNEISGQTNK